MTEKTAARAIPLARAASHDVPTDPRVADRADILARRIRLHERLVKRRRWSKELDRICRGGVA